MAISNDECSEVCQQSMLLLKNESAYSQVEVIEKLAYLGHTISKASFNNILKGQGAGKKLLLAIKEGMQEILQKELGIEWINSQLVKTAGEEFQPEIIPTAKAKAAHQGFNLREGGRMAVAEKVAFFRDAKHEVIEFGVTLSRFSNNLVSGSREEFRKYVESLLQRGVNFKCYLLNPSCNEARLYFGDRKTINLEEGRYERKIEDATFRLRAIQAEFVQAGYPGSFEVFTYEHVPYNYFMVVDMKSEHCKMVISHYMYGIKRSDSPVFEFTRKSNQELYNRYSRSIEALMRNAKRIIPHDHEFN